MRPGQETPDEAWEAMADQWRIGPASMRPGQETPDEGRWHLDSPRPGRASMRPGQETPDEAAGAWWSDSDLSGFNEAGARNPG